MLELEKAVEILLANTIAADSETVSFDKALGRIAAVDIKAPLDNPPFNRSPLDGYALIHSDTTGASRGNPVRLKVSGELCAGVYPSAALMPGCAVRIMTGGVIPEKADCVIRQENTAPIPGGVEIYEELSPYQNFVHMAEDYKKGTLLIRKNQRLNYVHLGILSGAGIVNAKVYRRLRIGVIGTGDEVVLPGTELTPGKIYDSNTALICARLREWGMEAVPLGVFGDDTDSIAQSIDSGIRALDLIITTGGASVGKKDIIHDVLNSLKAEGLFRGVAIKPGTPSLCGKYRGKLIICLSGNPFACAAGLELLARPVLAAASADKSLELRRVPAIINNDFAKSGGTRRFIRAKYENGICAAAAAHSSGVLSSFEGCNCFVDIPPNTQGLKKGDSVTCVLLERA